MKYIFALVLIHLISIKTEAQTYFLNGTAQAIGDDCYRLTGMTNYENGTVWYAEQLNLNEPFDLQFLMNFGYLDTGADGIVFVLQTVGTSAIGVSGGGMGYQNFGTSLGVEFDTYQNAPFGDPSYDHMAIEYNGEINHLSPAGNIAGPVQASSTATNIEDGEDHIVRITWNPETQIIQVYFDCVFRLEGQIDLINIVFGGQHMVYWGFTASTGGSVNNQTVCLREDILNQSEVTICTGASLPLQAGNSSNGVYNWTPSDYLSNASIANPVANPPSSITYTASYLDICNTPVQFEVAVTVQDLEISTSDIQLISCTSPVDASVTTNLDLSGTYTWYLNNEVVASGTDLSQLGITNAGNYLVEINVQDECFADTTFEAFPNQTNNSFSALICNGAEILLDTENDLEGTYSWLPTNDLTDAQSANPLASPNQTTEYIALFTDSCGHTIETSYLINVENLTLDVSGIQTLTCMQTSAQITADINMQLSGNYTWSMGAEVLQSGNELVGAIFTEPGIYTVEINVQDECFAEQTFEIPSNYSTYNIDAGEDLVLNCNNEEVLIEVQSNGGTSVVWYRNNSLLADEIDFILVTGQTGTYMATITHPQSGCESEDSMIVTSDFSTPMITIGDQDSLNCVRNTIAIQNVNVTSVHDFTIAWNSVDGNVQSGSDTTTPLVDLPGNYSVTSTDNETGCSSTAVVFIEAEEDFTFDISQVLFPNIITPNNDAVNQFWHPFVSGSPDFPLQRLFTKFNLYVYNRWGKMVFETNSFNNKWSAAENDEGTYYYVLYFETYCTPGETFEEQGSIFVAR